MKYTIENLLILAGIGLLMFNNAFEHDIINTIMNVLIRNAALLLAIYIVVIYLNDGLNYLKVKAQTYLSPKWQRFKRKLRSVVKR